MESKESLRRDYLFEREQKLISDMAHKQKYEEHERMRRHTSNYYDKIKDQVSIKINRTYIIINSNHIYILCCGLLDYLL